MALPHAIWGQLKSRTADDLIRALKRDGWVEEDSRGATRGFVKTIANGATSDRRRVVIHYHPKKVFGKGLMTKLIADIGWTADDLKRLKLIKRQ